jgi:hypothetical protein
MERTASPVLDRNGNPRPWVGESPMIMTREPVLNADERAALYAQYVIDAQMAKEKEMLRVMARQSAQEQAAFNTMMGTPNTMARMPGV